MPLDVIQLLSNDHLEITLLLDQLDEARRADDLYRLFIDIAGRMAAHESAEQLVVYPALVATRPDAGPAAERRLAEHAEVNELLAEMHRLEPATAGFEKRAGALALELRAHFATEEERLFPQLREAFSPAQLVELAERVAEAKRTAPAFPTSPAG